MQFELDDDDSTDDVTEPVAPGTSTCDGPNLGPNVCLPKWT